MVPGRHPDFGFWAPARRESESVVPSAGESDPRTRPHHPPPWGLLGLHHRGTGAGCLGVPGSPLPLGDTQVWSRRRTDEHTGTPRGWKGLDFPARGNLSFQLPREGDPSSVWGGGGRRQAAPHLPSPHPSLVFPAPRTEGQSSGKAQPCTGQQPRRILACVTLTWQPSLHGWGHGVHEPQLFPPVLVTETYFGLRSENKSPGSRFCLLPFRTTLSSAWRRRLLVGCPQAVCKKQVGSHGP